MDVAMFEYFFYIELSSRLICIYIYSIINIHPFEKMEVMRPSEAEDESQLWKKFRNGDEKAFTRLYDKYVVLLYNYGERLNNDKELIEDSIHDFFVQLWKNRAGINQTSSVKFYLYKGFKNQLVKNLEKKRRFPNSQIPLDYEFEIVFSAEFDLIRDQASQQQKKNCWRLLIC